MLYLRGSLPDTLEKRVPELGLPDLRGKGIKSLKRVVIFVKEAMQTWGVGKEVNTTEYYFFITHSPVLIQSIIVYQDGGIGKNLTSFYSQLTMRRYQWMYFSLQTPSI